ncbi:MAG: molybdopterin cofactor-binding domain-containing protein [Beijerinckiaceae bacterium]
MTRTVTDPAPIQMSRRAVLRGAAGLTFAFALDGATEAFAQTAAPSAAAATGNLNAYVKIAKNGIITIMAPVPEMGQATNTSLPLIIAEELDANWNKVRVETAPVAAAYDHPIFRSQFVVASLSTRAYWMPLRTAGAQARRVLMEAAAAKWKVPVSEVSTEPSMAVHAKSGRKLSYGEIAAFAVVPATLPEIKPADLKPVASFRLIGKDVPRVDVVAKSTGKAVYAIDAQLPGMVFATVARAPVMGATPKSHNGDALKQRKGITHIIPMDGGIGIVGERFEAVLEARSALKVEWNTAPGSSYDSVVGLENYQNDLRDSGKAGVVGRKTGEAIEALGKATRVITGEYTTDYVAHVQMEPLSCLASVTATGVDIWAGTQWPSRARDEAAKIAGVGPEKVNFRMMPMGGGFGRRAHTENISEAVTLSKAVGKPVKLISTREDDIANSHLRPMTAHKLDIGLDAAGKIIAWKHRLAADLVIVELYGKARLEAQKGVDHIVMAHADVPYYDVGSHLAEHVYQTPGVRTGAWRGIGAGPNAFAIESMIDELAKDSGKDPLAYRLSIIKNPRAKALLEAVAGMSGWTTYQRRDGRSLGLAFSRLGIPQLGESMAATVVETTLNSTTGKIGVSRIWCAVDAGLPIQPRNLRHQVEGSLIWGVSSALTERATVKNGAVQQSNYTDYEVLRASATPEVFVTVIPSGDIPLPVGELGLGTVIPAVANAIASQTGKRLRNAPFTRERVLTALKA